MFRPNFHVPGTNTDALARRIVTSPPCLINLLPQRAEPIIPVVQELTQELSKADVIAVSTDKDILINQSLEAAKQGGLNQLNEFHSSRIAGRLSAGHMEDPHAIRFIEEHGLNQGVSEYTSETVDALTAISTNIGKDLTISYDCLNKRTPNNMTTSEFQKNTVDQAKEALIATSLLRKHALLKQVLPEFLRKTEASRAVLVRSERTLQEQNYREAGLSGDDLIEQMKEYDQDIRDALKNQQFTDTSYATIKQLGEQVSGSLGMSTQQLSDALKEHGKRLSEAARLQGDATRDAARLQGDAMMNAAILQSDATRDAAILQSDATRDAARLESEVSMQAARLATHMGTLQIAQSNNTQLLLSDIYDKLSETKPKTSGASNVINDTYHVVRSLDGGKDLLQTGMNMGTSLIGGVGNALAGGCHIM
jgi:hypothetical protein